MLFCRCVFDDHGGDAYAWRPAFFKATRLNSTICVPLVMTVRLVCSITLTCYRSKPCAHGHGGHGPGDRHDHQHGVVERLPMKRNRSDRLEDGHDQDLLASMCLIVCVCVCETSCLGLPRCNALLSGTCHCDAWCDCVCACPRVFNLFVSMSVLFCAHDAACPCLLLHVCHGFMFGLFDCLFVSLLIRGCVCVCLSASVRAFVV